jgi:hypothetical protein
MYEDKEDVTIRRGFEPGTIQKSERTDSIEGNDEDGSKPKVSRNNSEEAHSCGERDNEDQGPDKSDSRYAGLDDGDVWKAKDGNNV